jgi:hypothetical protein
MERLVKFADGREFRIPNILNVEFRGERSDELNDFYRKSMKFLHSEIHAYASLTKTLEECEGMEFNLYIGMDAFVNLSRSLSVIMPRHSMNSESIFGYKVNVIRCLDDVNHLRLVRVK